MVSQGKNDPVMNTFKWLLVLFLFSFQNPAVGQSSDVLLTIGDHEVSKKEFLHIYNKNQQNIMSGQQTDVEEYLDLFINFKLKVIEARERQLDTIPSVEKELEKYKDELARPYLIDRQVFDRLLKEAYGRSKKEVQASHILVTPSRPADYKDTLRAYKKIQSIRKRILQKKEPFNQVARATSDDPSVKSNGGNLGFFTALQMVYPIENKAYSLKQGEISRAFRTRHGYHLLKKTGEREARGRVKVAHIMLVAPESMPDEKRKQKKEKINEIYHELKGGASFEKLAKKYSDDQSSAQNGGELPWFGVGRMVPSFEKAAFSLEKTGNYSRPVKTPIGWHIIKLLDREQLGSFQEEKPELRRKITQNPRYQITQDSLVRQLKKNYAFTEKRENFLNLYQYIDREAHEVNLDRLRAGVSSDTLFAIEDQLSTTVDFADFLQNLPDDLQGKYRGQYLLDTAYARFRHNQVIEYEKEQLPEKYPEYKYVLKEYQDGILLFEIMDRQVWSKASQDTVGLKKYHSNHKDRYMWGERFRGTLYLCDDQSTLKKVRKMKKGGLFRKKYSDREIKKQLNTSDKKQVEIQKGIFQQGENQIIDHYAWNIGEKSQIKEKEPYMVRGKKLQPQPKSFQEARGAVLADYQNYLENQWLQQLKDKYKVQVNQDVFREIKQNQASK